MEAHLTKKADAGKYKSYHLTRPLRLREIKKLHCKKISCPPSSFGRLSNRVKKYLNEKKVEVSVKKHKGKPLQTNPKLILQIISLYKMGLSYRKIEKETKVPKSTVHYLIKKAKRTKVKRGKTIVTI